MAIKKQNYFLNFWKGLACFGVVFFHTRFPNYSLDGILQTMFRWAIPLFFMVSGYYCYNEDRHTLEKKMKKKITHIFWINLIGCSYYFLVQLAIGAFGKSHGGWQNIMGQIKILFTTKNILIWLIFNQDPFVNIMWFTSALLYCYLIFWGINHFNLYKVFYILIPILIAIHMLVGNLLWKFGIEMDKVYFRNFLLFGIPFFMYGNFIHKHQKVFMEKCNINVCRGLMCSGLLLGIAEWFLVARKELYIGSILLVTGIFIMTLHKPENSKKSFWTKIGSEYSLIVYIFHYSLIIVLNRFAVSIIYRDDIIGMAFWYIRPFLVFGVSVVVAIIFTKCSKYLKQLKILER